MSGMGVMSLGRAASLITAGVAMIAASVTLWALFLFLMPYTPVYDENDPDHDRFAPVLDHLGKRIGHGLPTQQDVIDVSDLNRGAWKTVCLFGGYENPLEHMQGLGATIDAKDRSRLERAGSRGFRLAQVEEFEMMIAYVDPGGRAHFVNFRHGIGAHGQHL